MPSRTREPNWKRWLASWDRQQESFNPDRERRFEAMFDVLAAQGRSQLQILDLGCGPGSLTLRALRRFPRARSIAVDFDPVILRIARGAVGSMAGRVTWVDADLRRSGWEENLPRRRFDAAISTTALHWLESADIGRLYRTVYRLIRPGGLFVNGDHFPWPRQETRLRKLTEAIRRTRIRSKPARSHDAWTQWWRSLEREKFLRPEFQERAIRFAVHPHHEGPGFEVHLNALRRAGFRDVATVWQDLENRVLVGLR
ncbi:MAG: class I SAM-dependent methyltransferase [Thermoplasmata archaeon]